MKLKQLFRFLVIRFIFLNSIFKILSKNLFWTYYYVNGKCQLSCMEVHIQLYKNWMMRKLHIDIFNVLHYFQYHTLLVFTLIFVLHGQTLSINIVNKTVIFYRINCSRLKEYFEKPNHRKTSVNLRFWREAQFYRYFNDVHGWSGGGRVSLTTFIISEKLFDFQSSFIAFYLSYIY